jgi:hypothetical protein
MTTLASLWLPIVLSAVAVFVASSIIHMVLPWHKSDYARLPDEDAVRDALRPFAIPPGDYMVPRPQSMAELRTPEFAEKAKQGPVMVVTVMPNGMTNMGRNLVMWFIYSAVIAVFAAYIAGRALAPGADDGQVLRFVGATAFIAYAVGLWQMSIWYNRAWSTTIKSTVDGLIYGVITAFIFCLLWPK